MSKVMVFGVFDQLHPGHLHFFEQARALGDTLVVSIARDSNVERVKNKKPLQNEHERLRNVMAAPGVSRAMLGGVDDPWPHIIEENPDIIALGYDQNAYVADDLEKELAKHDLGHIKIIRLQPYHPEIYKSSLLRNK